MSNARHVVFSLWGDLLEMPQVDDVEGSRPKGEGFLHPQQALDKVFLAAHFLLFLLRLHVTAGVGGALSQ